jgi:hypothetical protein
MKKPFRLKLNAFVSGQKIEGVGSLNLSNAWNDPSFVREKAYYELAASLGLKAPRSNFAALYINDQYWGLYVLGETVDSDFLKNYFGAKPENGGNLYKADIGAALTDLGTDKAAYKQYWEKQSNEDADDWSDLIALTQVINHTPIEQLHDALEAIMDTDSVLTALALDNATVNLDSYVGTAQNYNLYLRPSDNRWVWIVWDPSLAFGGLNQSMSIDAMKTMPLDWVFTLRGVPIRPLATRMWAVPEYQERYRQIYARIVEHYFKSHAVLERMNTLRAMIRPWVKKDTQKLVTMEQFNHAMSEDQQLVTSLPGLKAFIPARLDFTKTQLANDAFPRLSIKSDTAALDFTTTQQSTTVSIDSSEVASYSLSSTTDTGGNWLTLTPTGGPLPGKFQVSATTKNLATGTYTGTITIHAAASTKAPLTIPVTLTIP